MSRPLPLLVGLMVITIYFATTGCAGPSSTNTPCEMKPVDGTSTLRPYSTVYVEKVACAGDIVVPDDVLTTATAKIVSGLSSGKRFVAVVQAPPSSGDFLRLSEHIIQYDPGNRFLRTFGASATLKIEVTAFDGSTGKALAKGYPTEYWAWGGALGAVRGIEDMMNSACDRIGSGVSGSFGQPSQ